MSRITGAFAQSLCVLLASSAAASLPAGIAAGHYTNSDSEVAECIEVTRADMTKMIRSSSLDLTEIQQACADSYSGDIDANDTAELLCTIYLSMGLSSLALPHCSTSADQGSVDGILKLASIYINDGAENIPEYIDRIAPDLEKLAARGNEDATLYLHRLYMYSKPERALEILYQGANSGSFKMKNALCQYHRLDPKEETRVTACDQVLEIMRTSRTVNYSDLSLALTPSSGVHGYIRVKRRFSDINSDVYSGSEEYYNAVTQATMEYLQHSQNFLDIDDVYSFLSVIQSQQHNLSQNLIDDLGDSLLHFALVSLDSGHSLYPDIKEAFHQVMLVSTMYSERADEFCGSAEAPQHVEIYQVVCESH